MSEMTVLIQVRAPLMKFRAPSANAAKTREIATDYFRTDPRKMAVNYAALTPETGTFEVTAYSPDAPPEDIVLVQGDHDDPACAGVFLWSVHVV